LLRDHRSPYQGKLNDSGNPANGNYDFQLTLWDALSGGTQQPQPLRELSRGSNRRVRAPVNPSIVDIRARSPQMPLRPAASISGETAARDFG
jgi:hypothetical protein